jgi:hypothetical protein
MTLVVIGGCWLKRVGRLRVFKFLGRRICSTVHREFVGDRPTKGETMARLGNEVRYQRLRAKWDGDGKEAEEW